VGNGAESTGTATRSVPPPRTAALERLRVEALRALHLLDEPITQSVQEIVRLAAEICHAPIAMINILDDEWAHTLAPVGLTSTQPIERHLSLCHHVVDSGEETVVPDARLDPRFAGNPYVDGTRADMRFYASVPLRTTDGQVVGTLCAFDRTEHDLLPTEVKLLRSLGDQLIGIYELRRSTVAFSEIAQRLAQTSSWATEVLETSRDAYYAITTEGVVTSWNHAAEELFGWTAEEAIGRNLDALILPDSLKEEFHAILAAPADTSARGDARDDTLPLLRRDGSELTAQLKAWRSTARPGWHAFVRDVTQIEIDRRERRRAEALLATAFEHAPHGSAVLGVRPDDRGRLLRVNPALGRMMHRDDLAGGTLPDLLDQGPDSGAEEVLAEFERLADGRRDELIRLCRFRAGGGHIVVEATLTLVRDARGEPESALAQLRDVTRQVAHEDWLTRHAKSDALTGLANRMAMKERLDREIEQLRSDRGVLAVMMLDLDRFKSVNDTLGHAVGDELLQQVALALTATLPPDGLAVRLGGDEFVVIVSGLSAPDAAGLAGRITAAVDAVAARVAPAPERVERPVTCSLGLVTTRNPATAPEDLVREADQAMYRTKRSRDVGPGGSPPGDPPAGTTGTITGPPGTRPGRGRL
jgi:diguanylate cyclase